MFLASKRSRLNLTSRKSRLVHGRIVVPGQNQPQMRGGCLTRFPTAPGKYYSGGENWSLYINDEARDSRELY